MDTDHPGKTGRQRTVSIDGQQYREVGRVDFGIGRGSRVERIPRKWRNCPHTPPHRPEAETLYVESYSFDIVRRSEERALKSRSRLREGRILHNAPWRASMESTRPKSSLHPACLDNLSRSQP